MKIKTELLKKYISDCIINNIEDFEIVEEIVRIFADNNIDCGSCHDF